MCQSGLQAEAEVADLWVHLCLYVGFRVAINIYLFFVFYSHALQTPGGKRSEGSSLFSNFPCFFFVSSHFSAPDRKLIEQRKMRLCGVTPHVMSKVFLSAFSTGPSVLFLSYSKWSFEGHVTRRVNFATVLFWTCFVKWCSWETFPCLVGCDFFALLWRPSSKQE